MLALMLLACWNWDSDEDARVVENQHDMEDHYTQAAEGRDSLIRGDLPGMKGQLAILEGRLPLPALPPELRGREAELSKAVAAAAAADTLEIGAGALADVAAACGACHSAADVDISLPTPEPPKAGEMRGHQWAAARMWDGLVGGSDAAVAEGFGALAELEEFDGGALAATATPFAGEVTALAERAAAADAAGRRAAYGEFLETCAACHALTDGGPEETD